MINDRFYPQHTRTHTTHAENKWEKKLMFPSNQRRTKKSSDNSKDEEFLKVWIINKKRTSSISGFYYTILQQ